MLRELADRLGGLRAVDEQASNAGDTGWEVDVCQRDTLLHPPVLAKSGLPATLWGGLRAINSMDALSFDDALALDALVSLARLDVAELLGPTARPLDHHLVDTVPAADAKRHRKLRLRQVARPGLDHP
jgi:hypothetical protein